MLKESRKNKDGMVERVRMAKMRAEGIEIQEKEEQYRKWKKRENNNKVLINNQ